MKIVFMGTPPIAAQMLQDIVEAGTHQVVGVVTVQDKKVGRGQKVSQSAVKKVAMEKDLPLLQPEKLKDATFLEELAQWNADLFVVVAFRMLPEVVWDMPPKGTINLHASLLPQYRGAAPINWAIINGEQETGVTTFFIEREIDTGKIIEQRTIAIEPGETAGTLHDKIMYLGSQTLQSTLETIAQGKVPTIAQPQSTVGLKPAPKLFKEDCLINWEQPIEDIRNRIHGLSPYPGAFTHIIYKDKKLSLKIFQVRISSQAESKDLSKPILLEENNTLFIRVRDGILEIIDLQLEGKRRILAKDFLKGFDVNLAELA